MTIKNTLITLCFAALTALGWADKLPMHQQTSPPIVAATIAPLHSLVTMVMKDVTKPQLIIQADVSAHHATLVPSQIKMIQNADIVFYIDLNYESFLSKPLRAKNKMAVRVLDNDQLTRLPLRTPCSECHSESEEDLPFHHHKEKTFDPHIWLDIDNGIVMLEQIAKVLSRQDPGRAATYNENAAQAKKELRKLKEDLLKRAVPFQGLTFIATHDGFQYLEHFLKLKAISFLGTAHSLDSSAKRYQQARHLLTKKQVQILFQEPQIPSPHLTRLSQDYKVSLVNMDTLGLKIAPGLNHYSKLMINLVEQLENSRVLSHVNQPSETCTSY